MLGRWSFLSFLMGAARLDWTRNEFSLVRTTFYDDSTHSNPPFAVDGVKSRHTEFSLALFRRRCCFTMKRPIFVRFAKTGFRSDFNRKNEGSKLN